MAVAELHFFDKDDPNGSTIFECSTDDQFLKQVKLDIQRDSLGNGHVDFARKVPAGGLFTRDIVVPEALVRILVPEIDATHYLWGFFINPRQQQVVSRDEQGGEGFSFAGPGPKHYLERMVLWSSSFSGFDNAVEKESGIWTWPSTARAGVILDRLLQEEQDNPHRRYLIDLTQSFGSVNDSAGVPWADDIAGNEDFTLNIGDDYLKILWQIEDASEITTRINLGTVSNPLLQLDAYQTFGRDLTGPIGAGNVHFTEGVNIATDLDVEGSSYAKASDALVKGNDGVYHFATNPSYTPGDLRKVVFTKYSSANTATLERAGERYLRRQDNGEKQIDLRIVPGFDDTTGLYMPSPASFGSGYFWVGDTVSLTTGIPPNQTELDYDDEPQAVTGIQMELEEAVRDDDAESAARSWLLEVQLNHERKSSNSSRDLAGNRGSVQPVPQVYKLCRLPTEGTDFVARYYPSDDAASITPLTADAAWADGGTEDVKILKGAPDNTLGGGGHDLFSASGVAVSNRLLNENTFAVQITGADLLAAVQAGGLSLQMQMQCRSRYGAGISESAQNNIYQWVWRVYRSGTGFIDTMLDAHSLSSGTKFPAQATFVNRTFSGTSDPVPSAATNDWIVIEVGTRHLAPTSGGTGARVVLTALSSVGDLPEDETTTTLLNTWIQLSQSGIGGSPGDLPADTVRQGEETAGTSTRVSRCDHQHAHGLLAFDGSNYHGLSHLANYIFDSDVDPGVSDDSTAGFAQGSLWINHSDSPASIWILQDPDPGAAVWVELNVGSAGSVPSGTDPGDILAWDGAAWDVLPIGADGEVLAADSGQALGLDWETPASNVSVRKNSTGSVYTRGRLNFIEGSNVTLTVADDAGNNEIDITVAAAGTGGGAPATISILSPSSDTYLNSQATTTNYDTATTLLVGNAWNTSSFSRYALYTFDISGLASTNVQSAILSLYRTDTAAAQSTALGSLRVLQARRCIRAYSPTQTTWNIYSTGNNWTTVGGQSIGNDVDTEKVSGSAAIGANTDADTWHSIDIARLVQDSIGASETTLRVMVGSNYNGNGSNAIEFASIEHASANLRPTLRVTHT